MSTGMAGLGDIERALDAAVNYGASQISLLHCGSSYPLGPESANLAAMETLKNAFGVPVGYSDHTLGIGVPIAVATLGGSLLEKHITLSRKQDGPDHNFAIEPTELISMVKLMRDAQLAIGGSRKVRQLEEEEHLLRGRRSIFTIHNMKSGEVLSAKKVKVVRPGIGLEPMFLELLIGKKVNKNIPADHPLSWDDFVE
jgi:sialic acid synthase SpsE